MADPRIGTLVDGRYRVDERLAAGGTGVVYVGTQLGLDRRVAIKFLHKSSARSRTHTGRFEREARVMSQMGHPNIAQIIDFGSDEDGSNYLVMELCKGVSLRELLTKGPLDLPRAIRITRQILSGLAHAHDANVVHRDLKPGNVLLVDDRLGEDRLKILDFGVAKIMSSDGPTELSVAAGGPLGTPHYMSPEQATQRTVDARSDLYALGVMLYEMTTGKRPFEGGVGFALLRQHVEDTARPPHELREMSPELERVILHAMEKNPDQRFQTAVEMMVALSRVPEAAPATAARKAGKRALIAGIALVGLATAAGVGWYGTTHGWFKRGASGDSSARAQGAVIDAGVTAPYDAARARRRHRRAKPVLPPWKPPAPTVMIPSRKPFPTIDNKTLKGRLFGKRFRPRFAALHNYRGKLLLRLTENVPSTRFCSDLKAAELGPKRISITLPALPKENQPLRARRSNVLVTADEARQIRHARWRLRFNKLDADARIAVGSLRIDGRKIRLRGNFIAAYCPGPGEGDEAALQVNGLSWNPARAPAPDELPVAAIAGVLAHDKLVPARVHVSNAGDPQRTTLTFFAKAPDKPCAKLGNNDVGAAVTLPGGTHAHLSVRSRLAASPASAGASAVFHLNNKCPPASADCPAVAKIPASVLSLEVDAELPGELRGRIYVAAPGPHPSLLVGAFRARDCRKAKSSRTPPPPGGDAGSADASTSAASSVDAGAGDASTASATSADAGATDARTATRATN